MGPGLEAESYIREWDPNGGVDQASEGVAWVGGASERCWLEGFARSGEGPGSGPHTSPPLLQDILNHVFDDVESFVSKLQKSAEAARVLEHRERGRRTRRREAGGEGRPSLCGIRVTPSPGHSQMASLSLGSPLSPPASLTLHPNLSGALPRSDAVTLPAPSQPQRASWRCGPSRPARPSTPMCFRRSSTPSASW